jgi:hypothetical protein
VEDNYPELLDALYRYMFSKIEAIDRVLEILTFPLRGKESRIDVIEWALASKLQPGGVETSLADLTSIITIPLVEDRSRRSSTIKFLHASLPAFLLDESRSGRYHISSKHSTRLACNLLMLPTEPVRERDRTTLLISLRATVSAMDQLWQLYDSILSCHLIGFDNANNMPNFIVQNFTHFFEHFDRLVS